MEVIKNPNIFYLITKYVSDHTIVINSQTQTATKETNVCGRNLDSKIAVAVQRALTINELM